MPHELVSGVEILTRGGFMMYPLCAAALIALTVILERSYLLLFRFMLPGDFVSRVLERVRQGALQEAVDECRANPAPVSGVLTAGLTHFSSPVAQMELAMKNEAERWMPRLEKRIEVIDTVVTAAPLMGLLGTITGMMASFQVLSQKGVNEPSAITGGVAEALIATATGLVIALLCLVAYNFLATRVKTFVYELESVASQLLEARLAVERGTK